MVNYGFVIDNRTCIDCHACTVACKSEQDVPIGVNRTHLKYIETGTYPYSNREFSVHRCNHCEDSPCTTICPTTALFNRKDGFVDFDNERRPLWMKRPLAPPKEHWYITSEEE